MGIRPSAGTRRTHKKKGNQKSEPFLSIGVLLVLMISAFDTLFLRRNTEEELFQTDQPRHSDTDDTVVNSDTNSLSYTGYVLHIRSGRERVHVLLGWNLETYNAIRSIQSCCWRSHPNILQPLLENIADVRREWIEKRYACLLQPEWRYIVIGIENGSCWGEFPLPTTWRLRVS